MENYWKDGTGSAWTPCICEQCGSKSSRSTVPPKHVLLYWEEVSPKQRDARQQPLQGMHIANVDCRRTLATGHRLATAAPASSSVFLAAAYVLPSSTHTGRRRAVSRSLVAAHARGENGDRMQNTGQTTARVVQTWTATRGARRISRRVSWDGVTKRSSRLERASCARHACHAGRRVAAPSTRSRSGGARLLRLRRPGCHTTRHTPGAGAEERSGR